MPLLLNQGLCVADLCRGCFILDTTWDDVCDSLLPIEDWRWVCHILIPFEVHGSLRYYLERCKDTCESDSHMVVFLGCRTERDPITLRRPPSVCQSVRLTFKGLHLWNGNTRNPPWFLLIKTKGVSGRQTCILHLVVLALS